MLNSNIKSVLIVLFEKEIMSKKKFKWTLTIFLLLIGRGVFGQTNNDKNPDNETDTLKTKQIQEVLIKSSKEKAIF